MHILTNLKICHCNDVVNLGSSFDRGGAVVAKLRYRWVDRQGAILFPGPGSKIWQVWRSLVLENVGMKIICMLWDKRLMRSGYT